MAVFILLLSIVLLHPIPVLMTNKESLVAPNNNNNNSTSESLLKMRRRNESNAQSVSVTLQQLSPQSFGDTNNNPAIMRLPPRPHALTTTHHDTTSDSGHGRRNFNGFARSTPAGLMSSSALSPQTEWVQTSLPSLFSNSDTPKEMEQKAKQDLSVSPVYMAEGTGNTSDDVSVDPQVLLKLDRNYTPKKIAEYIVSTGDEKGITQVIVDMVQDGQLMASGDDVILFLETVQQELKKLRSPRQDRYSVKSAVSREPYIQSQGDRKAQEIYLPKSNSGNLQSSQQLVVSRPLKRNARKHYYR